MVKGVHHTYMYMEPVCKVRPTHIKKKGLKLYISQVYNNICMAIMKIIRLVEEDILIFSFIYFLQVLFSTGI